MISEPNGFYKSSQVASYFTPGYVIISLPMFLLQRTSELLQVMFILFFTVYLFDCVNYDVLFNNAPAVGKKIGDKITLADVASPPGQCMTKLSPMVSLFDNFLKNVKKSIN